mmetsp:Transcript_8719/g.9959  ORF Transcript_8719/g.9959 Transcript_8719/m.9959 type:complete len:146 (+) Transcript_8719:74-511(+)
MESEAKTVTGIKRKRASTKTEVILNKLAPFQRPEKKSGNFDLFVSRKKHLFGAYCRRTIDTLLCKRKDGIHSVTIHGLGAAVLVACKVALWVERRIKGKVVKTITTSTVELLDEKLDREEGAACSLRLKSRHNSAIHIQLSLQEA